jgi:hypothetical protein
MLESLSDGVFNLHQKYLKSAEYYIFILSRVTTFSSQELPFVKAVTAARIVALH